MEKSSFVREVTFALPFGILESQGFEQEEDATFYEMVHAAGVNLVMVKHGRKLMWRYLDKTFTFVL